MSGNRIRSLLVLAASCLGLIAILAAPSGAAAKDRNHDRIPDRWERHHHLSLGVNQAHRDQDRDNLGNRGEFLTREQVAQAWLSAEYEPVVELMRQAGLCRRGTETEAYERLAGFRYLLLRTHEWSDDVIERIREELERPGRDEDTGVHELRRELR